MTWYMTENNIIRPHDKVFTNKQWILLTKRYQYVSRVDGVDTKECLIQTKISSPSSQGVLYTICRLHSLDVRCS